MKIHHVVSCCLLSALCVDVSAVTKEVVGGQVMFSCSFTWAGTHNKYFCNGTCSDGDILVETKGSKNVSQGRYRIEDKGNVFYLTIKNLMKTDSGTYWCGVRRYGLDTLQEVHLTVTDAPPKPSPVSSRPHVSTTLPNLSTTFPNLSTTFPNTSTTLQNLSTTFLPSGDISVGPSQRAVVIVVCVSLAVLVVGLILLLIYKWRRDRKSSTVVCVLSGVIINRATEGGNAHIQCPYDRGYETYQKYLSKGIYSDSVVVIQTPKHQPPAWTHPGRYSLYDDTERRVFTVTITNLVLEDADTYWCGVDTWGHDQPTEVRLTVDRAPVPPNPGSITSRPLLSTSHPSTNITMTTDSSNSATDRTNGTVGTKASPSTDLTRTQGDVMFSGVGLGVLASKHSARLLVSDSMTTNQDPDTGTITNPIYATGTNHNPYTACDITIIYAKATNPHPDDIYSNVGGGEALL
ncbi:uncharacterized protein [Salvelinus alpinus]|uniref:uncharacterized protein isoform X2 n=1 Tax=Salvelinus alpinus TaxID=8036 RepID=UPI0039FDCA26